MGRTLLATLVVVAAALCTPAIASAAVVDGDWGDQEGRLYFTVADGKADLYVAQIGADDCRWSGRLAPGNVRIRGRAFTARIDGEGEYPTHVVTTGRFTSPLTAELHIVFECTTFGFDRASGQTYPIASRAELTLHTFLKRPSTPWEALRDFRAPDIVKGGGIDCTPAHASQTLTTRLRVTHRVLNYTGNIALGAPEIHEQQRSEFDAGTLRVRGATCRNKHRWWILDSTAIETRSAGLDHEGRINDDAPYPMKGWGVAVQDGRDRFMTLVVMRCGPPRGPLAVLNAAANLPLPGPWAVGVGQWGIDTYVPKAKENCAPVAELPAMLSVSEHGFLKIKVADWGPKPYIVPGGSSPVFDTYAIEGITKRG